MLEILDSKRLDRALNRIVYEILERNQGVKNLAIIGIKNRGDILAKRIIKKIKKFEKKNILVGAIDITFYRDDVKLQAYKHTLKTTEISFPIDNKILVLVDDVIFTGRTVRAAIDVIIDMGRPKEIQLAVLIDRGSRELPIQPDYVGKTISPPLNKEVTLQLKEIDGKDRVSMK